MLYGVGFYLHSERKVLMMKKAERKGDPNSRFYSLPGGKLKPWEKGSNPDGRLEATIREAEEETGIKLVNPKFRGTILFDNTEKIFEDWPNPDNFLVFYFEATEFSGELKGEHKGEEPIWVFEKEIPTLPQNDGDRKIYEWLKQPKGFSGVIYHKGKILDEENTFVNFLD
jgi:8-oxo-dGTP pyrophosphatase MutT (NUDIX family)